MDINIVRSNRRSVAIQITPDLTVVVRAPYRMPQKDIDQLLKEKEVWIQKHIQIIQKRKEQSDNLPKLTQEDIQKLANEALSYIPKRVEHFAPIVGVNFRSITIRNQKTRWEAVVEKEV